MADLKKKLEAAVERRVYTYVDDQGREYYSFHQAVSLISPPTRLKLRDKIGMHLIPFLSWLRQKGGDEDFSASGRVGASTPTSESST